MSRIIHVCLDIKGALLNWDPNIWRGCVTKDDGSKATPSEFKMFLLDELSKGRVVIPFDECEGFDYSGGGCPGHSVVEEA